MILVSEVVHNGEAHFQVNSCFVSMISMLYPNEPILVRAETEHITALRKNLVSGNNVSGIEFLSFDKYYDVKKYNWGLRIIGECIEICKTLLQGKARGNKIYVWTCLFPTGHFFLNIITYFQKKKKHVIILHGELEYLKSENKHKSEKLFGFFLKIGMNLSTAKNNYVVLGDNIKNNLAGLVNKSVLDRTFSILHPYNYSVEESYLEPFDKDKFIIGAIGTQMLSKNSQYIFQLAELFRSDILQDKFVFKTIGKLLPELDSYQNDLVENLYANDFVSQKQFEFEISKLNFVIFFYDNNSYQLCASGAVLEAIRMGILIISIENDFFRWVFDRYGAMGFLCKDLDAMELLFRELKEGNYHDEMEIFKNNIIQFRVKNDLNILAASLKNII